MINEKYPELVQERRNDLKLKTEMKILIGNTVEKLNTDARNCYKWCFFIEKAAE